MCLTKRMRNRPTRKTFLCTVAVSRFVSLLLCFSAVAMYNPDLRQFLASNMQMFISEIVYPGTNIRIGGKKGKSRRGQKKKNKQTKQEKNGKKLYAIRYS